MSEMNLLFLQQISKMFVMLLIGYGAVKIKLLPATAGKGLSQLIVSVIKPLAIFYAFQVEFSIAKLQGMLLAMGAAILTHIVYIFLSWAIGDKLLHLPSTERACMIYSNSGNLLMPLISAVMGQEWLFYTCAYMAVLQCFVWIHGKSLICETPNIEWKKAFLNINIIIIGIGLVCFCFQWIIPGIPGEAIKSIADSQGAANMLSLGISFATLTNLNLKKITRVLLVSANRLIVYPAIMLAIFVFTGLTNVTPEAHQILLITLLAAGAPSAVILSQIAQINGKETDQISLINVFTMLCSIVTLPALIWVYERVVAPF